MQGTSCISVAKVLVASHFIYNRSHNVPLGLVVCSLVASNRSMYGLFRKWQSVLLYYVAFFIIIFYPFWSITYFHSVSSSLFCFVISSTFSFLFGCFSISLVLHSSFICCVKYYFFHYWNLVRGHKGMHFLFVVGLSSLAPACHVGSVQSFPC